AAVERAMKVQEVIMRAMAKRISWWEAAEILGVSTRTMRRMKRKLEQGRLRWFIRPSSPPSQSETSSSEGTREGAGVVPGTLFGFQRPSFSREVTRATRRPLQLHVGQEGAADIGFSCRSPETGAAPPTSAAATDSWDAASH